MTPTRFRNLMILGSALMTLLLVYLLSGCTVVIGKRWSDGFRAGYESAKENYLDKGNCR